MIRSVDLDVASQAAASNDSGVTIGGDFPRSQVLLRLKRNRMVLDADLRVALLTQEWGRRNQQAVSIRTVGKMATRAALGYGSVLPDEGTPLIAMAIRTQLEDRVGTQKRVRRRAMRLMAVITFDLAFEERHMRSLSELDSLTRMTGEARSSGSRFPQQSIL